MVRKYMEELTGMSRRNEVRRRVIVAAVRAYQLVLAFALKPVAGHVDARFDLS